MAKFGDTKFWIVLRWLLVPFVSIIGSTIIFEILIHLFIFQDRTSSCTDILDFAYIMMLSLVTVDCFVYGFTFVLFGAYTAPSNRYEISKILALLVGILCFFASLLLNVDMFSWLNLIFVASAFFGAIYAVKYISKKIDKDIFG